MKQPIPFLDRYVMLLKINEKLPLSIISVLLYETTENIQCFFKIRTVVNGSFLKSQIFFVSGQVFKSPSSNFHTQLLESALLSSESFLLLKVNFVVYLVYSLNSFSIGVSLKFCCWCYC